MKYLEVEKDGKRIDAYLAEELKDVSRVAVQRLITNGKVLVNDKKVKVSYKVQQGDKTAFLLDPRGTAGESNYPYKGYLLCDSSFNIVKYSKTTPYGAFYPGGYYIQGVPQSEHSYGEDVIVSRQPESTSNYILLDTSTHAFTYNLKMSETKKVSHYKYADFGRFYTNQLSPTYDMADPQKQYFLMNGSATDSIHRGVFAEPSFKEWVFKFKLNTPMQKTANEVMKLTFDITVDI